VRAGFRVAKKTADALVEFRTDDVFELAGLRVGLMFVNSKCVLEQPFRKPMATHHVSGAALTPFGELHFMIFLDANEAQILHAGQGTRRIHGARGMDVLYISAISLLAAHPYLFQQMIIVNAVVHGDTLVRGKMAMSKFDAAIGLLGDVRIVGDHENGVAGTVKFAEQRDNNFLVGFVEIPGRLIGKNDFWLIDERARDCNALLFSARKLRG
jgi:hypothetical protein